MSDVQGHPNDSSRAASGVWRVVLAPAPTWLGAELGPLIFVLGLFGLIAFGLTGFSGDANSPNLLLTPFFVKPILLFWWLCALVITLQLEALRHPAPGAPAASRGWRSLGLIVSLISIAIWTALTFAGNRVSQVATTAPGGSGRRTDQVLAILFNVWCVAVFWGDTARRWIQWQRGKRRARAAASSGAKPPRSDRPAWRRIVTDFMSAALLTAALTVLFSTDAVSLLEKVTQATISRSPHLDACTVSVIADCDPHQTLGPFQTLSGLDRFQAIAYFVLGGIVLATFLLRTGFTEGFRKTIDELVRVVFESPRRVLRALFRPLQHVLWPICVFAAIGFETLTALYIQSYLHLLSEQHVGGIVFDLHAQNYSLLWHAVLFGALAPLTTIVAVVIMLYSWDEPRDVEQEWAGGVWTSWFNALVQIGLAVMASFLVYSLVLSVLNGGLVYFVPAPVPQPFVPPGVSTYAVALVLAILLLVGRWQGHRRRQASEVRAAAPHDSTRH